MKVYTAGPISGQSYEQVMTRYRDQVSKLQSMGYEVLCPMTGKEYLRTELEFKAHGYDEHPVSCNHAIKERDRWMVGEVDIVLVDFTEANGVVSIGSCMELAWADELRKQTIVVMDKDNIHQHCFILECADIVFPTIEEAYKYLEDLSKGIDLDVTLKVKQNEKGSYIPEDRSKCYYARESNLDVDEVDYSCLSSNHSSACGYLRGIIDETTIKCCG